MARPRKHIEVLPPPIVPDYNGGRTYYHVLLNPNVIERLKVTAHKRGYKPGPFLEVLLDTVLPSKVDTSMIKSKRAKISYVRTKEKR
jgi:hypothetical protein